jgi:tRNA-guanine transglycosylase
MSDEATNRKRTRSDDSDGLNIKKSATAAATPTELPEDLQNVDFSQRVSWRKFSPYNDTPLIMVAEEQEPVFTAESPALCHYVNAISHRARACLVHTKPQSGQPRARPIPTPIFMPVGTKGCIKGLTMDELTNDSALGCPIILANTYHLAIQPGTELIKEMNGLHAFQGLNRLDDCQYPYNLLTDSGGFQMVSLVKLSEVTEEGVCFDNPFQQPSIEQGSDSSVAKDSNRLLLRPEDSIRHQNNIGANIIMALDDVVSTVAVDRSRFVEAAHRTLRWYDRCYQAHEKKNLQNLFPILQGHLDIDLGGLREQCLAGFRYREETLGMNAPGYAIGGLAGGEDKEHFWRVVDQACRALPDDKPRYLMGVGYPLDLVVCTALGVDMYDCVYPTRTARFGVCLVPGRAPGTLKIKAHDCALDTRVIQVGCGCQACRMGISRARLHALFKARNPVAVELITQHNIAYMMELVRSMRQAILKDQFAAYATKFVNDQYPGVTNGGEDIPKWVIDALAATGINVQA